MLFDRCPPDFAPEALAWWAPEYTALPEGIETCPIPSLALLGDWTINLWATLGVLDVFDGVLVDRAGADALRRAGFSHVVPFRQWTFDHRLHRVLPGVPRDIDIFFAGSFNPEIYGERDAWLARVAALGDRHRVVITSGVYGEAYGRLLNRARIVFNRTLRGELNMRAYEAAATGALLFIERENREVSDVFTDRRDCVLYGQDDLQALLEHYLAHEPERARVAAAGQARVQDQSARHRIEALLDEARGVGRSARTRFTELRPAERTYRLALKAVLSADPTGVRLALRLLTASRGAVGPRHDARPTADAIDGAQATILATVTPTLADAAERARVLGQAEVAARSAVEARPDDPIHQLRAGEIALLVGDRGRAAAHLERSASAAAGWQGEPTLPFPFNLDRFRIAWDCAAQDQPRFGATAARLVKGRALRRLAEIHTSDGNGDAALEALVRSIDACPHLDGNTHGLGALLEANGHTDLAVGSYRAAIDGAPLDFDLRARLVRLLLSAGRAAEAHDVARASLGILRSMPPLHARIPEFEALLGAPAAAS